MSNLRQAAQQALEYIEATNKSSQFWLVPGSNLNKTVTALKQALAEPEQEPVAYFDPQEKGFYWAKPTVIKTPTTVSIEPLPLYSAPTPRRPLTDEEIDRVTDQQWAQNNHKPIYAAHRAYARAVIAAYEAKQGEQT